MNESLTTQRLHSKNVVVIGGSKGVGRAIVAAAHAQGARVLAIARQAEPLKRLADEFSGVRVLGLDALDDDVALEVFDRVAAVGAREEDVGHPARRERAQQCVPPEPVAHVMMVIHATQVRVSLR